MMIETNNERLTHELYESILINFGLMSNNTVKRMGIIVLEIVLIAELSINTRGGARGYTFLFEKV